MQDEGSTGLHRSSPSALIKPRALCLAIRKATVLLTTKTIISDRLSFVKPYMELSLSLLGDMAVPKRWNR